MATGRSLWVDNLRSFVIILVVAHHAALAYTTFGRFNAQAYIFSNPHPMIDTQSWIGMDRFVYFNDIFFMVLMFFISGLFVVSSLKKKGTAEFVRERFNRLFIPFIFGVTVLMEIAHYPSYVVAHNDFNILHYLGDFFTTEYWPVGPPWFLWVLFFFSYLIARFYDRLKTTIDWLTSLLLRIKNKVALIFILFFLITWILYVPMRWIFGPSAWWGLGPFDFQECRQFLYLGYFVLGIVFGNISEKEGLFSGSFIFLNKWLQWSVSALLAFCLLVIIDQPMKELIAAGSLSEVLYQVIYCSVYVASCTLSCLAFLSLFRRFANFTNRFWDSMKSNSFFIYLWHYIFVIWMQYLLLGIQIPAILKFIIVTVVALLTSWVTSYVLRKNSFIRRYI